MDLSFALSVRVEQLNTTQKLGIFKFLFIFHFAIIFCSLSSSPVYLLSSGLSSRFLLDRCFYLSSVIKIYVRKGWFGMCIGMENIRKQFPLYRKYLTSSGNKVFPKNGFPLIQVTVSTCGKNSSSKRFPQDTKSVSTIWNEELF